MQQTTISVALMIALAAIILVFGIFMQRRAVREESAHRDALHKEAMDILQEMHRVVARLIASAQESQHRRASVADAPLKASILYPESSRHALLQLSMTLIDTWLDVDGVERFGPALTFKDAWCSKCGLVGLSVEPGDHAGYHGCKP